MRNQTVRQRPVWKKILFFAALVLFIVGTVAGVSAASAIAVSESSNGGTEVKQAKPIAATFGSSGQGKSDAKIFINDNGKRAKVTPQSNAEPGTVKPMVNIGTNTKFPQTGEKSPLLLARVGMIMVLLSVVSFGRIRKHRLE